MHKIIRIFNGSAGNHHVKHQNEEKKPPRDLKYFDHGMIARATWGGLSI